MSGARRSFAFCSALIFLMSLSPVYAFADTPEYTTNTNFWHWLAGGTTSSLWHVLQNNSIMPQVLGYIQSTDVCAVSSDNKHHASSVTGVSDDGYCICVCENCGNEFTSSTLAGEVYTDYVDTLPVDNINSSGGFFWYPTVNDLKVESYAFRLLTPWNHYPAIVSPYSGSFSSGVDNFTFDLLADSRSFLCSFDYSSNKPFFGFKELRFNLPVSGQYTLFNSNITDWADVYYDLTVLGTFYSGYCLSLSESYSYKSITAYFSPCEYHVYFPVFSVVPSTPYDVTSTNVNDNYSKFSRPSATSGVYGVIDGNGNVQKIESNSIVNEDDHFVYNPVTNTIRGITDWNYDYDNRSYDISCDDGSTMTVTYGNDNVTILEDGASYNVYYITEVTDSGSGSDSGGGSGSFGHTHNYMSTITTAPTCVMPGVRKYTCECGASYTEQIPAVEHSWIVKTESHSLYSSDGTQLQEGFIIYQCTVCGEEYKAQSGGLPPGVVSYSENEEKGTIWGKLGTLLGSIALAPLRLIEAALGKILDGLISLAEVISERLEVLAEMVLGWFDVIPGMFSGFTAFLFAVFAFLPEDVITLLVFGMAAVVFIGIVKAIRG